MKTIQLFCIFLILGVLSAKTFALYDVSQEKSSHLVSQDDDKIALRIGDKELRVEYADTQNERALGLMYRRSLCDDCGMLFKFDQSKIGSIWMKNTFIPLDLAYINKSGEIINIFQLVPHDLTAIRSTEPVLYALEMNKGWFDKNGLKPGDVVTDLP